MSIEQPPTLLPWVPPKIDKSLPRPAPTMAYSWKEYNSCHNLLYLRDHRRANHELSKLDNATILGFDIEWKPIYRRGARENPVALVQLANYDSVLLLQISAMEEFPSKLADILANPNIVKAGVGIQNDAIKLYNDYRISISNCVDLSLLARTVDNARWQGKYTLPLGLARLIESYEYRLLVKGKISRSNWEAVLSEAQQEYASNDAHAGFILYLKLESLLPLLPTPPDRRWYSFNVVDGQLRQQDDDTQWHAENPNYDPGPLPPPKLPKEVKASMIITDAEVNGEPSATKAFKNENRFQHRKPRKPEQSTSQFSAVASGSAQYLRPQGQRMSEHIPQSLPRNSGHRPTGDHGGYSAHRRVGPTPSSLSSNIRNTRVQSTTEQLQIDKSYPRRPRRRPRHSVSQNTATTDHS